MWSIANVDINDFVPTVATRVEMERRHFYNGQRWPIEIRRLALCIVNPTYRVPPFYHEGADAINVIGVGISVPQRYHLGRQVVPAGSVAPRPTWTPAPGLATTEGPDHFPSSLWGQSMLAFDNPLMVPQRGTILWDLSAYTPAGEGVEQPNEDVNPLTTMLYQETEGLFAGSARTHVFRIPFYNQAVAQQQVETDERWPYFKDTRQLAWVPAPGVAVTTNWWDPAGHFTGKLFDQQESTRSGSTEFTSMRVQINQRERDLTLNGIDPLTPSAPLSLGVGTRVRSHGSGSNTYWWRPGAPLALVFDHITPANVYNLKRPITLRPGEQLEVELLFPPQGPGQETPAHGYHIGVSLNGFAVIEG